MAEIIVIFSLLLTGSLLSFAKADESVAKATRNLPPNAYYYYLKALDVRLQAAWTNHTPPPAPPGIERTSRQDSKPYKKNAAEIKADAEALEIVRKGFSFRYKKPQIEQADLEEVANEMVFNSGIRQIAQMLKIESEAQAKKGDWAGAANNAVDGIRLSQDISHGTIEDMLTGQSIQLIISAEINNVLRHVNASTAQMVTKRLEIILSQQVQYADIIQAEKLQGLQYYDAIANLPNWRKDYPTTKSLKEMRKDYIATMNGLIANAKLPYPQRKTSIHTPGDPINRETLDIWYDPDTKRLGLVQGLTLTILHTRNALFLLEFALRAYQLQHGNYPQKLSGLVPGYLQKIPNDPFATNSPLKYKRDKTTYILYSIGPDGKDDGGKDIKGNRILVGNKGDILAGSSDY